MHARPGGHQPDEHGRIRAPVQRHSDGTITTQFTMTTLEELGLLKMDFLGLRDADRYSGMPVKLVNRHGESWIWTTLISR